MKILLNLKAYSLDALILEVSGPLLLNYRGMSKSMHLLKFHLRKVIGISLSIFQERLQTRLLLVNSSLFRQDLLSQNFNTPMETLDIDLSLNKISLLLCLEL